MSSSVALVASIADQLKDQIEALQLVIPQTEIQASNFETWQQFKIVVERKMGPNVGLDYRLKFRPGKEPTDFGREGYTLENVECAIGWPQLRGLREFYARVHRYRRMAAGSEG